MEKRKIIGLILGIFFILFGFIGFFATFARSMATTQDVFTKVRPMNEKNGLAVDSEGNIYIGDAQGSYIQVFDNIGKFIYGISFETGGSGWFAFGIDEKNIIHIVTARTESHFQFLKGNLISTETITYEQRKLLEAQYHMSGGNIFTSGNKEYQIVSNIIRINDISNNTSRNISIHVPIWPFPVLIYWLIAAIGMVMFFWSFGWELMKAMKRRS